uniref:HEAT repeat domain-containing protein n=1 Tax=uncultured bacterium contig00005 TaxID=1181497 RepID=A0A806KI52_9BACT|nr:hypothetical protein [uncultured bacterium contig00005]
MKARTIQAIIGLTILTVVAGCNTNKAIREKYAGMTQDEVVTRLESLGKDAMVKDVKAVFAETDNLRDTSLIPFAAVLSGRANEFSEDEMISFITDRKNNWAFRTTVLQIYYGKGYDKNTLKANAEIRSILINEHFENDPLNDFKSSIIAYCDFSDEEGMRLLSEIAEGNDDLLAFVAIKKLSGVDGDAATDIVDHLLETYKEQDTQKVNIALKVKAAEYKSHRANNTYTDELRTQKAVFIGICVDIINASNEKDDTLTDAAVFALGNMTDFDALTAVVTNESIDISMKMYVIDMNYETLLERLGSNPSDDDIAIICEAISIYPLYGLKEPLADCRSRTSSEQLVEKIDASIALIEQEGLEPNDKWSDKYDKTSK